MLILSFASLVWFDLHEFSFLYSSKYFFMITFITLPNWTWKLLNTDNRMKPQKFRAPKCPSTSHMRKYHLHLLANVTSLRMERNGRAIVFWLLIFRRFHFTLYFSHIPVMLILPRWEKKRVKKYISNWYSVGIKMSKTR